MRARAPIIWLASFPKSGSTWFRILLANLNGEDPIDINCLPKRSSIASSRQKFEAATMLDSTLLSHEEIDDLRPSVYKAIAAEANEECWIKVHDAYTTVHGSEPLLGRNVARAAIYLVRDPRDVVISWAMAYHKPDINVAIKFVNSTDSEIADNIPQLRQKLRGWSGHVTSWLEQTDVPIHVVRYEDLQTATAECFAAALKFVGRSATLNAIERAVRHSDFTELQRQEIEKGFVEQTSRNALFFRSGRVGGWRESLTAAQTKAIEQCNGAMMARLGYRLSQ